MCFLISSLILASYHFFIVPNGVNSQVAVFDEVRFEQALKDYSNMILRAEPSNSWKILKMKDEIKNNINSVLLAVARGRIILKPDAVVVKNGISDITGEVSAYFGLSLSNDLNIVSGVAVDSPLPESPTNIGLSPILQLFKDDNSSELEEIIP